MSRRRELAGVIPAAGLSSRMGGDLKPLLRLDGVPAVLRCARAFSDIGARPLVVLGFQADRVTPLLRQDGVHSVINPDYARGMFSSLQVGLQAAAGADLIAVLPADTPLVRAETIGALARAAMEHGCKVAYPIHEGRRGHPPVLGKAAVGAALSSSPLGGLRDVLAGFQGEALEVPVNDPGVLLDMDAPDDYARVARQAAQERIPGREECLSLMAEWDVPDRVQAHSIAVTGVARCLAIALNRAGAYLNLKLLEAAALLHDVRRQSPEHAAAGAAQLNAAGLPRVAAVVARHMEPPRRLDGVPGESALLYLADKLVLEDVPVPLETRLAAVLERFAGDEAAGMAARRRLEAAMRIAAVVRRETGCTVQELLRDAGGE